MTDCNWWHTHIFQPFRKLRQVDGKFEVILCCITRIHINKVKQAKTKQQKGKDNIKNVYISIFSVLKINEVSSVLTTDRWTKGVMLGEINQMPKDKYLILLFINAI